MSHRSCRFYHIIKQPVNLMFTEHRSCFASHSGEVKNAGCRQATCRLYKRGLLLLLIRTRLLAQCRSKSKALRSHTTVPHTIREPCSNMVAMRPTSHSSLRRAPRRKPTISRRCGLRATVCTPTTSALCLDPRRQHTSIKLPSQLRCALCF